MNEDKEKSLYEKTKEKVTKNLKKDDMFFGKMKDNAAYRAVQTGRKAVLRAKSIGHKVVTIIEKIISLLASPAFWVIVLCLIIILFLWGVGKTMGSDSFEYDCGETLEAPNFTTDEISNKNDRAKHVMGHLMNNGMTKEQASVIAAYVLNQSEADPLYNAGNIAGMSNEGVKNAKSFSVGLTGNMDSRSLASFAEENGSNWKDASTQLMFLSKTLSEKNSDLKKSGFIKKPSADSLEKGLGIEIKNKDKIKKSAKNLEKTYKDEGQQCKTIGDGTERNHWAPLSDGPNEKSGLNKSSAADLAWDYSWDYQGHDSYEVHKNGGLCGNGLSCLDTTPEKLAQVVDEVYATDPDTIYGGKRYTKDCGRNVALAMKGSGTDPDYPWGNVAAQEAYMKSSSKYEEIDCNNREAGDILIYADQGHTLMYVGTRSGDGTGSYDGDEFFVEASLNQYEPEKKPYSYRTGGRPCDSFDGQKIRWYRFKG